MLRATLIDLGAGVASMAALALYELWLRLRSRREPRYSLTTVNALARAAWVERIMQHNDHILAVQTLRNSTMTASFLASTAVLVIIGVLNLAGRSGSLSGFWHTLNVFPEVNAALWTGKIVLLVLALFAAFFCFTLSVRLYNHVGYLVALPAEDTEHALPPAAVARVLNQAGHYLAVGLRAHYFSVPVLFWLFGPQFMIAATAALIVVLARIDRAPR